MSPIGTGNRYYSDPESAERADLAEQIVDANGNSTAFETEDADVLLGKLVVTTLGTSEVQQVAVDATGGTYTLTFDGQETAAIDFDATAAELQTALEALSNIAVGDIEVTGGPGDAGANNPYVVTFRVGADVAEMTSDATNLTGGLGTATVSTTTPGDGTGAFDVSLETLVHGDWYTVDSFPQVTATDLSVGRAFSPLGEQCRWAWTIGAGEAAKFELQVSERRQ